MIQRLVVLVAVGVVLAAVAGGALGARPVQAQESITLNPTQITVATTGGTMVTRSILLQAQRPLTNVEIIASDLLRSDGGRAIPARQIRLVSPAGVSGEAAETAPRTTVNLELEFDFRGVPSGEFNGNIRILYDGGSLNVPVLVRVKHGPIFPFVALLLGVVAGVGISVYRAQSRPRDEVLVRLGRIRSQVQEAGLPRPFLSRINTLLFDADTNLDAGHLSEARTLLDQAEMQMTKWQRQSADWQAQLDYRDTLQQELDQVIADTEQAGQCVATLQRELRDVAREVPDMQNPQELRERLDTIKRHLQRYLRLRQNFADVEDLHEQVQDSAQATEWAQKAADLRYKIENMLPSDDEAYQKLLAEIRDMSNKLREAVAQERFGSEKGVLGGSMEATPSMEMITRTLPTISSNLPSPPDSFAVDFATPSGRANLRLQAFTFASYLVVVLLLATAGFNELYISNPIFGSNPWSDYIALLAWGFGAEASRVAITGMTSTSGVPGIGGGGGQRPSAPAGSNQGQPGPGA